jgi:tetratricopeptide (TPR) repeat protein/tRNA A-37 threonylcarbamoyl transferase component Bud32
MQSDTPSTLDILDAFDAAWQQPVRPRLEDFLRPPSEPGFREVLIGLVCIDLERRTKAGERARVEEYLSRFPELRQGNALLELVLMERELRRRHDPAFQTQGYSARFPELASQLATPIPSTHQPTSQPANAEVSARDDCALDLRDHVLLDLVGRGGMGEVYCGRDPALGRNLAVKVLRPELCGHPEAERRFQQEARINGLLQHPCIVPVHNLGRLADGRMYFTMKLIQGRTLADILAERPTVAASLQLADGERQVVKNLPPQSELLGIFEKVAQALAYAHSKRVIHRDLKPANIMVGAFGEVQVMDWGLAKILQSSKHSPAAESTLVGTSTTGSAESTAAEYSPTGVVGTPAYMAPEQARGASNEVDERADVFGLGGILCAILTGRPPYTGHGREEVLRKAVSAELADAFARLMASGADDELVQLAKACLAMEKDDRPANAGAVAERLTVYLAGVQERLRAAELERAAAQARAEEAAKKAAAERRARRVLMILSAAVLVVVVAGITGTTWGLVRAKIARGAEEKQREIAQQKQLDAQRAEAATLADYRASTDDAIEQLIGSKPVLGPQEKAYLEKMLKRWQAFAARTGEDERARAIRAEGQFRVAVLRDKLGQGTEALAGYGEALSLYEKLAEEFPAVPDYREGLARTCNGLGLLLKNRNERDKAAGYHQQALSLRQKLADELPDQPEYRKDLAETHSNLGTLLQTKNQWAEAVQHYHEALAIQQRLAGEFPTSIEYRRYLAGTHNNLGALLAQQKEGARAVEQYDKALVIRQKLADGFPAVPLYRKDLADTLNNLAIVLKGQNELKRSAQQCQKSLIIRQKLADEFPAVPSYRLELAGTHTNLGLVLEGLKQGAKATQQYDKALTILRKLTDEFPAVPAYRQHLARTHNALAVLLAGQDQAGKAAQQYHNALDIQQKLADDFPDLPVYRQELAGTHNNLGYLLAEQKQPEKAREQYRKALAIRQKLAEEFPTHPAYQLDLGCSYLNYGNLVREGEKPADSLPWYDNAVRALTRVHQRDPRGAAARQFLRNSHLGRAMAHEQMGKHSDAGADWTRGIELTPPQERVSVRSQQADALVRAGHVAEAVALVTELRKSATLTAEQWYDFGCIYAVASSKSADKKKEYADQAMRCLRHAVQAGYKDFEQMAKDKDLDPLHGREDFKKLIGSLAKPAEKPQ